MDVSNIGKLKFVSYKYFPISIESFFKSFKNMIAYEGKFISVSINIFIFLLEWQLYFSLRFRQHTLNNEKNHFNICYAESKLKHILEFRFIFQLFSNYLKVLPLQ